MKHGVIKIWRLCLNTYLTVLLFLVVFVFLNMYTDFLGNTADYIIKTIFIIILILIAETDYYTYQIPNPIIIILCGVVLVDVIVGGRSLAIGSRIAGFVPAVILLMVAVGRPGAVGGGDVKLIAVAGVYLGIYGIINATITGSILAGCIAAVKMIMGKADKSTKLAMAPYYAVGIFIYLIKPVI